MAGCGKIFKTYSEHPITLDYVKCRVKCGVSVCSDGRSVSYCSEECRRGANPHTPDPMEMYLMDRPQ